MTKATGYALVGAALALVLTLGEQPAHGEALGWALVGFCAVMMTGCVAGELYARREDDR